MDKKEQTKELLEDHQKQNKATKELFTNHQEQINILDKRLSTLIETFKAQNEDKQAQNEAQQAQNKAQQAQINLLQEKLEQANRKILALESNSKSDSKEYSKEHSKSDSKEYSKEHDSKEHDSKEYSKILGFNIVKEFQIKQGIKYFAYYAKKTIQKKVYRIYIGKEVTEAKQKIEDYAKKHNLELPID